MNKDNTIYALYHHHIYDAKLNHYRNIDTEKYSPHKLVVKLLTTIAFDMYVKQDNIEEFDESNFRFFMIELLLTLVMRDKKSFDIIRNPHLDVFDSYDEKTSEYIRMEDNGEDVNIFVSPLILDSNSHLFRDFLVTLMADTAEKGAEPIHLVIAMCAELVVFIQDLYNAGEYFKIVKEGFDSYKSSIPKEIE